MAEYIDRDAVYTAFANACTDVLERASEIVYISGYSYEHVIEILDDIPTVNVAPIKHGQWEWFDEDTGTPITGHEREWGWRCSHCKHELPDDYDDPDYRPMLDYCPYCGAKMDGGESDTMTAEEALHICKLATKCAVFDQQCTDMTEFIDAMKQKYDLEVMVDCIQKQIPKKPIEKFALSDDIEAGLCPFCNEEVDEEMNFCSYCGQAIYWED